MLFAAIKNGKKIAAFVPRDTTTTTNQTDIRHQTFNSNFLFLLCPSYELRCHQEWKEDRRLRAQGRNDNNNNNIRQ